MKSFSCIFTDAEVEALRKRLDGCKEDGTGIYSARVKPKLKELVRLVRGKYWRRVVGLVSEEMLDEPGGGKPSL